MNTEGSALNLLGENSVEMLEQGGFAGTVRTDQPNAFTRADLEADALQSLVAIRIIVTEIADFNRGVHRQPRAHIAS